MHWGLQAGLDPPQLGAGPRGDGGCGGKGPLEASGPTSAQAGTPAAGCPGPCFSDGTQQVRLVVGSDDPEDLFQPRQF